MARLPTIAPAGARPVTGRRGDGSGETIATPSTAIFVKMKMENREFSRRKH
jgi:hypothetical protein